VRGPTSWLVVVVAALPFVATLSLAACARDAGRGEEQPGAELGADGIIDGGAVSEADLSTATSSAGDVDLAGGSTTTGVDLAGGSTTTGAVDLAGGQTTVVDGGGTTSTPQPAPARSCATLPKTCGASGHEDCCETIYVPGGTFLRSYDGVRWTNDQYPATVSPFWLDRYEVTVERFYQFHLAWPASKPTAGAGAHPNIWNSGWQSAWDAALPSDQKSFWDQLSNCGNGTYFSQSNYGPHRPMSCLPWTLAFAFCIWDGGRLPTEAEWNFAAAGGSEQRFYPWSSPASSTAIDATRAAYSPASVSDVGMHPLGAGRWGHEDLIGNVGEFVRDWNDAYLVPCVDCITRTGGFPVLRGGSYHFGPSSLDVSGRWNTGGAWNSSAFGLRCARDAAPRP
jgi:formylglycine-generating enzyme required for sulfatase activity